MTQYRYFKREKNPRNIYLTRYTVPLGSICDSIFEVFIVYVWAGMTLMHSGMSLQDFFKCKNLSQQTCTGLS